MNYDMIFLSMRSTITIVASIILAKYFIYLMLAPFYTVKTELFKFHIRHLRKKKIISDVYKPLVSIIIPAWNEEVGIITTIESALSNTYNNIEVIVVDDGSTDSTAMLVRQFKNIYEESPLKGKTLHFYSVPNGGKARAMNFGIKHANGQIIVTMDADSAHHPNAISNLVGYFQDPTVDAVVGNVKISNSQTIVGMIQKFEYIFGFYFKRVHSIFNAEYIFGGACAAFRKSTTFDKLGYFDPSNKTEDIEYSMRIKLHGLKAIYAEDVIAYTEGASTLGGLYKQRLRWKKGRIDTFIKYKQLFLSRSKNHSKFMSWVVLPYALLSEAQLLFEPFFFTLIWTYTLISGDYLSVGLSSLFISFSFLAGTVFGDKKTNKLYFFYFPAFWLIFYILVAVEFLALIKSIELLVTKEDVTWQKWDRQGIKQDLSDESKSYFNQNIEAHNFLVDGGAK